MDVEVRDRIPYDDAGTAILREALVEWSCPDDKISEMARRGELIRLRRGYYALGQRVRRGALSLGVIAGTLYGPSYISLEYALAHYGLIPERVTEVTSVCLGRSRTFKTPVGNFSYAQIKREAYVDGFDMIAAPDGRTYFMAYPEKALVDIVELRRGVKIFSQRELAARLFEDLRMDEADVAGLNLEMIEKYAVAYSSAKTRLLVKLVKNMKGVAR